MLQNDGNSFLRVSVCIVLDHCDVLAMKDSDQCRKKALATTGTFLAFRLSIWEVIIVTAWFEMLSYGKLGFRDLDCAMQRVDKTRVECQEYTGNISVVGDSIDQMGVVEVSPCIKIGCRAYLLRRDLHECIKIKYKSVKLQDKLWVRQGIKIGCSLAQCIKIRSGLVFGTMRLSRKDNSNSIFSLQARRRD